MQFVPKRKIWFAFSGTLIVLSIAALAIWGLKLGIDFSGGSLLELQFSGEVPASAEFAGIFEDLGIAHPLVQSSGQQGVVLRFQPVVEEVHQSLIDALAERYEGVSEVRFDSIGSAVGRELFQKSVVAILVVTVTVLIYLAWSFRKVSRPVPAWVYGVIVIITFLHDTIIPLGVFAWLGEFRGVEIGSPFIAAVLLILGYSINDTIVVLDRIRENIPRLKGAFEDIVEASVHQTITRSVSTSFTTLLVLFAILIFGGATLQIFSLALIIGIIFGAYSSIFIAAPLLVTWYRWKRK